MRRIVAVAMVTASALLLPARPSLATWVSNNCAPNSAPDSNVTYDRGFDAIRNAEVLILDDYGAHSSTPWARITSRLLSALSSRSVPRSFSTRSFILSPSRHSDI